MRVNNMKANSIIAALALAAAPSLAATPAPAQSVNIIFTAENASCAAWTKSSGNSLLRAQYAVWARGFVSGHNYANPARQVRVGAFPGGDELYQYFDNYCRDNPQHSFVEGVIHLVTQLRELPAPAKSSADKAGQPKLAPAGK
jgi:hypothetical protein